MDRSPFTLPRLLICEGEDDKAFFASFIEARALPRFHIQITTSTGRPGGNTKFVHSLRSAKFNKGFDQLRHIIVATDCDGDHERSFHAVQQQIRDAGFEAPTAPLVRSSEGSVPNSPTITILMVPLTLQEGVLETMLVMPTRATNVPMSSKIDQFVADVGGDRWASRKQDKLWLRAALAARCERDPFVSLPSVLTDQRYSGVVDLRHPSLDDLAGFLGQY